MANATFSDTYYGATPMTVSSFKTTVRGAKVIRFRWTKAEGAAGSINTGFAASGFASEAQAIAAASRHARFSNVGA